MGLAHWSSTSLLPRLSRLSSSFYVPLSPRHALSRSLGYDGDESLGQMLEALPWSFHVHSLFCRLQYTVPVGICITMIQQAIPSMLNAVLNPEEFYYNDHINVDLQPSNILPLYVWKQRRYWLWRAAE